MKGKFLATIEIELDLDEDVMAEQENQMAIEPWDDNYPKTKEEYIEWMLNTGCFKFLVGGLHQAELVNGWNHKLIKIKEVE